MSDLMTAEPQPGADLPSASNEGGKRRLLLVGGAVAVLLVLGLAVYFLFLSGGTDEEAAFAPIPKGTPAPTATHHDGKADGHKEPKDVTVKVGRDPFAPLSVEAVKVQPSAAATTDSGSTTADSPKPTPAPTVSVSPSPVPTQTQPSSQPDSYKVTLKSVNVAKEKATIEVNGKRYLVKVKDMFTSSNSGPFKLTWVGKRADGKDLAKVVFGSDAPVQLVQKDTVFFQP
jgi:hypothetical protein